MARIEITNEKFRKAAEKLEGVAKGLLIVGRGTSKTAMTFERMKQAIKEFEEECGDEPEQVPEGSAADGESYGDEFPASNEFQIDPGSDGPKRRSGRGHGHPEEASVSGA